MFCAIRYYIFFHQNYILHLTYIITITYLILHTRHISCHISYIYYSYCNLYQSYFSRKKLTLLLTKTYSLVHKNLLSCSQKPTLLLTKTCSLTKVHPISTVSLSRNLYFGTSRFSGAGPFLTRPDAS